MNNRNCSLVAAATLLMTCSAGAFAQQISGTVVDKKSNETLIGAVVSVEGSNAKAVTDTDGNFELNGLKNGKYTLNINYVGYKPQRIEGVRINGGKAEERISVALQPDEQQLGEVVVTAVERRNTEAAMVQLAKNSAVIVSNVSAQEISRTQDTNAGEVVRRVPGVSLIDDKFVMVRGLSQRYNNVWVNGGAVPSSEADSRAFSFDIIPSQQIDNLTIVKSPSAEYPADYSGGFIIVNTKEIPDANSLTFSVGGNWNTATAFKDFSYYKGSATDFLGFDNGKRSLQGGINARLNPLTGADGKPVGNNLYSLTGNKLNNDWLVKQRKPVGDLKLAASMSRRWSLNGNKLGMLAAVNYTNEQRSYTDMQNNLFGIYDATNDHSNYLRHSTDNQYNDNKRFGALLNLALLSKSGNNKYELKNIFNRIDNNRYTDRSGVNAQSDNEVGAEYYYRSRITTNTQLTGKHTLPHDLLEWDLSYSYANRRMPDRKRYTIDDALEHGTMILTAGNEINREFTKLDEHIMSANFNEKHDFKFGFFEPSLKLGGYGEYRTRKYTTRQFIYSWDMEENTLPADFRKMNMTELLSNPDYFGDDKLYLLEEQCMRNNYNGNNLLGAGYMAASLPFGQLNIYAGLRFEYNQMELVTNLRDDVESHHSRYYRSRDLFPSINTVYRINDKNQVRLTYGKSVNRPEFREVSPSVYYDFDLASHVQGNVDLKSCYIHNIDLRYELYPSKNEQITLAAFYKRFDNPIEWTYTVAGGTNLIYSYENAKSANNYGVELDIRKSLDFIGLRNFSLSLNGALIHSRVNFAKGSRNENRPMQGQSPYLINAGLFYNNEQQQLVVSLLYNRIGKRIIGVGRSEGSSASEDNARVPDSYEMPRDVIDLSISKTFGDHLEIKANIRDLFAQSVSYKQFDDVTLKNGTSKEVKQITRQYKPGRNIGLSATWKF